MSEKRLRKRALGKGKETADLFKPDKRKIKAPAIVDDVFGVAAKGPADMGGVEKHRWEAEMLKIEWAVKYPTITPYQFLMGVKGFSKHQAEHIIVEKSGGIDVWHSEKGKILDKITESVAKRHIDLIAEVQEQHIQAHKVGLAKAVEMLVKGITVRHKRKNKETGEVEYSEPVTMPLRSVDLLNCMSSVKIAQEIYRKALGLPNEEGGLAQIIEKMQSQTVVNHTEQHLHVHEAPKSETAKNMETLSYDEIKEFIEYRREQKRKAIEAQKIAPGNQEPGGQQ